MRFASCMQPTESFCVVYESIWGRKRIARYEREKKTKHIEVESSPHDCSRHTPSPNKKLIYYYFKYLNLISASPKLFYM